MRTVLVLELRRRLRDRSAVVNFLVAPLLLSMILGFAFGGRSSGLLRIGVAVAPSGTQTAAVVDAGVAAAGLPPQIAVVRLRGWSALHDAVTSGAVAAGVFVPAGFGTSSSILPDLLAGGGRGGDRALSALHAPARAQSALAGVLAGVVVDPEHHPASGRTVDVVAPSSSSLGGQVAQGVAAAITSRIYAGALAAVVEGGLPSRGSPHADAASALSRFSERAARAAADPASVGLHEDAVGADHSVIGYFAPSMAVVFLFIGAGLGARAIIIERSGGTLARLAAAPVSSGAVVVGKMAAVLLTSLVAIYALWGETVLFFHASWGDPAGVALMCAAVTLAMCSVSLFLTSLARNEEQAFAATAIVGILLGLFGGNFFPPGSLPTFMQELTLVTPNGWALVGFGRLSLENLGAGAVVVPVVVLCAIAAVFGAASLVRIGRVVEL